MNIILFVYIVTINSKSKINDNSLEQMKLLHCADIYMHMNIGMEVSHTCGVLEFCAIVLIVSLGLELILYSSYINRVKSHIYLWHVSIEFRLIKMVFFPYYFNRVST